MNAKDILGKTVFFFALLLVIIGFVVAFGNDNALVGVMVIVAALMMMSKDLTTRPVLNLAGLLSICLGIGICSYLALISPWIGIPINFIIVFTIIYVTMHDLKIQLYFPFLLGYAFILSMPVSLEALPIRLLSLAVGAVFILALNIIVNRKKLTKTCNNCLNGIFSEVKICAEKKLNNEEIDTAALESKMREINSMMYDRLVDRFFTTSKNKTVLGLMVASEGLGRSICNHDHARKDLEDLIVLLDFLVVSSDSAIGTARRAVQDYITNHRSSQNIVPSLRLIAHELEVLEAKENDDDTNVHDIDDVPIGYRMRTVLRENLSRDSAKFTFAFRMALIFSIWAFVGSYFKLDNSVWLLFTSISIIQPYLEGTVQKSIMRMKGTVVGVAVFLVLMVAFPQPEATAILMFVIGYFYTLFDINARRYDIMMIFTTLSVLLAANMLFPSEALSFLVAGERLLYISIGIVVAMIANRVIMPYRLKDENIDLSRRHLSLSRSQIRGLRDAAAGGGDDNIDAASFITANIVSTKIRTNNDRDKNMDVDKFLMDQDDNVLQCAFLRSSINIIADDAVKKRIVEAIDEFGPDGDSSLPEDFNRYVSDLTSDDAGYVKSVMAMLRRYRRNEKIFDEFSSETAA